MRVKMKKQTPESAVLSQVRDYLRMQGWYVIRNQQGMGSHKGLPDLIGVSRQGDVAFFECKAPEHLDKRGRRVKAGKLSEHQEKFFFEMRMRGVPCYEIHSLEELEELGL